MHELLTIAEMREADRRTIAGGVSGFELMRRAGVAVARFVGEGLAPGARVLVLCGSGNNGGDGFVAAALMRERGFSVELALLGEIADLTGDAPEAARFWGGPVSALTEAAPEAADLVVDAVFGAGLSRPVEGAALAAIERANGSGRPILAVDIPSGVDGDTGAIRGTAIRAARTVTFARRKPGHLLLPGRLHCGVVALADIGVPEAVVAALAPKAFANEPSAWLDRFPRPGAEGHKYGRGHTLVLSGGIARTGAARLAARAALRAGSGLVTLASPTDALAVNAAQLTAIMLRECNTPADLAAILDDARFNAVVLGPALGIGERTRALVRVAAAANRALVLDADAITSFADSSGALSDILGGLEAGRAVLTPHEGELRRLFGRRGPVLEATSKLEQARRAAAALGAVVVFKGPDTVIAAPDGRTAINAHSTPYLASAGTGDVLAGMIGGLMAQGMPGFEAACAGVWLHGDVGIGVGPGLIAEDLPEQLPRVVARLLDHL